MRRSSVFLAALLPFLFDPGVTSGEVTVTRSELISYDRLKDAKAFGARVVKVGEVEVDSLLERMNEE